MPKSLGWMTSLTFETAWILPNSWTGLIDFTFNLVGSKSCAQINCTDQSFHLATPKKFERPFSAGLLESQGHPQGFVVMPVYHFVDCILDGKTPATPAEDGLAATQIIEAIERSIEDKRTVEVDEV